MGSMIFREEYHSTRCQMPFVVCIISSDVSPRAICTISLIMAHPQAEGDICARKPLHVGPKYSDRGDLRVGRTASARGLGVLMNP